MRKPGDKIIVEGQELTISRLNIWPDHFYYHVKESFVQIHEDADGNLYADPKGMLGKPIQIVGFLDENIS